MTEQPLTRHGLRQARKASRPPGYRWWIRGPGWLRRIMFRIYPGRWTAEEIADIRRRAAERKAELDRITE